MHFKAKKDPAWAPPRVSYFQSDLDTLIRLQGNYFFEMKPAEFKLIESLIHGLKI